MPSVSPYTYMHNHKVLNDKPNETGINNYNCRYKDTSPLPNSCQTKCIIYQENIDCDRFGNHKKSFNHVKHKNDTELSKDFWEIK